MATCRHSQCESLGAGTVLGYCGNVHPVRSFDELLAVIRGPAKAVRDGVGAAELKAKMPLMPHIAQP